jgi:ADP-ribosylglycohydrolase
MSRFAHWRDEGYNSSTVPQSITLKTPEIPNGGIENFDVIIQPSNCVIAFCAKQSTDGAGIMAVIDVEKLSAVAGVCSTTDSAFSSLCSKHGFIVSDGNSIPAFESAIAHRFGVRSGPLTGVTPKPFRVLFTMESQSGVETSLTLALKSITITRLAVKITGALDLATTRALFSIISSLTRVEHRVLQCKNQFYLDIGYYTTPCFDIGNGTNEAISNFVSESRQVRHQRKSWDTRDNKGNGCIMRIAPVAIMHYRNIERTLRIATEQCILTHASLDATSWSRSMALMIADTILSNNPEALTHSFPRMQKIDRADITSDGLVTHTFDAARWSIAQTNNFKDAVLMAVNLGDDSDTVGAVTGQLAGALYGASAIPQEWLDKLQGRDHIKNIADQLFDKFEGAS